MTAGSPAGGTAGPATGSLRLFLAIEAPPAVAVAIEGMIEALGWSGLAGLRPVRPEGVHLTLCFLGGVERGRVGEIVDTVAVAVSDVAAFGLRTCEPGVFPRRGPPKVLWVGLDGETEALSELRRDVEGAMASLGFPEKRRAFHSHLTVARLGERMPAEDRRTAAEAFLQVRSIRDIPAPVTHVSLMQSTLGPDGAVYSRLAHMPLSLG